MDKPLVIIMYKTADGERIRLEVTSQVAELLEQSDRQIRSQRRQDRRRLLSTDCLDELIDTAMTAPYEDIADLLIRMDSYQLLCAEIRKLPEVQKRRLSMYYFMDMTYRQIANTEGVGFRTVARSVERAIATLRKSLIM